MLFSHKKRTSLVCPKTGKPVEPKSKFRWLSWLFPISGLLALTWFLIRVIPKPSRATYPCQRVAFPIASGFTVWLLGLAGSVAAYRKAKRSLAQARYVLAAICIACSVGFIWVASNHTEQKTVFGAEDPRPVNDPIGEARGVNPGRVAWIHDACATSWPGSDGSDYTPPYWHTDTCTDPQVVNQMLSKSLRALTGKSNDYAAWDVIFRNFNQHKGRGDVGYTPGQKVAIKINFVLLNTNPSSGDKANDRYDQIDNSPQLTIALLKQLIDVAGVSPGDISIGDPLMVMPNHWYNMVYAQCPGVVYLTKAGIYLTGRTQVTMDNDANFFWSDPITSRLTGKAQDKIPTHFSQADYLINFPVLKSHNDGGITLSGKNHFGSLARVPHKFSGSQTYYDMHDTRATETPGLGHYRAIVDLMGHPKLGGKTIFTLIDGLYSGRSWDSHPIRWDMAPFNGDWPSSIFLSQDPIAADSVAFDFMYNEWDATNPDDVNMNGYPHKSGAHDYLHEAALVPDPPSDANYDPNHDGGLTESLGVHEHWNNATDKQYSRNLDPVNGTGIELVTGPERIGDFDDDSDVDFSDFAVLAASWLSIKDGPGWNADCDISIPSDGIIDELDLKVFCDNWLN